MDPLKRQAAKSSPIHCAVSCKVNAEIPAWKPLCPTLKAAYPWGSPYHCFSCRSLLKDLQAKHLQFPIQWHLQLTIIYWISSKEQTQGLSWWRFSWVVNVCQLPRIERKGETGTQKEIEREREGEMQRSEDTERETRRFSSQDCAEHDDDATAGVFITWICFTFSLSSLCPLKSQPSTLAHLLSCLGSLLVPPWPGSPGSLPQRGICFYTREGEDRNVLLFPFHSQKILQGIIILEKGDEGGKWRLSQFINKINYLIKLKRNSQMFNIISH